MSDKTKWMLHWCDAYDNGNGQYFHGKEIFDDKEDMFDRLEDLKSEYHDSLEYQFGKAKEIMMPKWRFLSELDDINNVEIPEKLFNETPKINKQPRIEDYIKETSN